MIFDDVKLSEGSGASLRGRQSRSSLNKSAGSGRRRRRSAFKSAARLAEAEPAGQDRTTRAWLWMLALLVLVTAGFAAFLHQRKAEAVLLPGEAPSRRIIGFVDPILAPLETGASYANAAALAETSTALQREREAAPLDDGEIFASADVLISILQEASDDRARHLQRLVDLGAPVIGMDAGGPKNPDLNENERKHLELAVDVSWRRNSGAYRNRVEELWYRLLRLEQGRFRGGSASQAMVPETK